MSDSRDVRDRMKSLADMRRKRDQAWELAGLARKDGDGVAELKHIADARYWSSLIVEHYRVL